MKFQFPKLFNKKQKSPKDEENNTNTFHKLTFEELAALFNTSLKDGLEKEKAAQLLIKNGKNKITQKTKNPIIKILSYFFTGFCGLIWIAAIICILAWKPIGDPPDATNLGLGILLILVIMLQAAFTAFQDWSSGRVMKSIKNMMPSTASVIRNGAEIKIPTEEVVVGDLVMLAYGNKVPADVRIVETRDLKFDKSMLTGESEAIEGTVECTDDRYVESKNIGFMTTLITNGSGKGVVVAVGDQTVMGKIAGLTSQTSNKETTLQKELKRFVLIIATAAVIMAVIVIIVWASWLRVKYPDYINVPSIMVNTISVMIAFIPESLPVCVTLSLLIIAKRMAKSRVLVKNLSVIETLSCVNVIASDKTGTLTQNKMFVANASAGLDRIDLVQALQETHQGTVATNQFVASCGICNNASFDETDSETPIKQRKANGDATDIALLKFSTEYKKFADLDKKYLVLAEIPFNSKNKWMMKIVKPTDSKVHAELFGSEDNFNDDIILLKGAPDYLLKKSTHILQADGSSIPLKTSVINEIIKLQNEWCIHGQRVLIICKRKVSYSDVSNEAAGDLEGFIHRTNDFTVIGLVGIIDPPREGISDVITKLRSAGIRVFMVTGDYALTAAAIAVQIGIFTVSQYDTAETMRIKHKENHEPYEKSALLLTGTDLENFTAEDWRLVTPYSEIVFARTTPEQKLKTVKEFQSDGYIVGVTGDGVNDAPALKSADIGIAMGSGSEVAMEASQLVLLDNNFSSILIAIQNGRLVFRNLRKVILYLLPGGCMAELIPVLMAIFIGVPQDLSSFQMLIISLFTDMAPSLSLMMEKPEVDLLSQPPRSKNDHLVEWKFILQAYVFLGSFIVFFSQTSFFIYMQTNAGLYPGDIILSFGQWSNAISNSSLANNLTNFTTPTLTSTFPTTTLNATTNSTATNTGLSIDEHYLRGQTVTFVAIVILQIFGNLLCTRTNVKSFFQHPPWAKKSRNLFMFGAQLVSLTIMLIVVYVPIFHNLFNTRPLPAQFIFLPFAFVLLLFILEELRKFCVRSKILCFPKIAW